MTIEATSVTQSANELLKLPQRELHYLIIKNKKGESLTINVGKNTHDKIKALQKND